MANPYDITQVDVPGLLSVYRGAQTQRLQQLMAERQMKREDAEEERRVKREGLMAKVFQGGDTPSQAPTQAEGGDPASVAPAPQVEPPHPADVVPQGAPTTLVHPTQLPPRTDGLQINHDALAQLYALDPQTAQGVQNMVYQANEQQFKQIQRNGEAMASAAYRLKQIPQEQRAAELQAMGPQLASMGLSQQQLAQADLSDAGLSRYLVFGQSLKDLVTNDRTDAKDKKTAADQQHDREFREARERHSQALADKADARAGVRFNERDLDRKAIAASGRVSSNIDDLNY